MKTNIVIDISPPTPYLVNFWVSRYGPNVAIDISPPIPYLVNLWVSSYGPKCCQPIKLQDSSKCNTSRKKWMMNCIFGMQIDIEIFYELIQSFYVCVIRHARSTQSKFTYFSNISRKAWEINLIFCLQINRNFLQPDSITLDVLSQACPKYSKQQVYNIFAISQGNVKDEVDFLPANKGQRFLQNDTVILGVSGQVCPNWPK